MFKEGNSCGGFLIPCKRQTHCSITNGHILGINKTLLSGKKLKSSRFYYHNDRHCPFADFKVSRMTQNWLQVTWQSQSFGLRFKSQMTRTAEFDGSSKACSKLDPADALLDPATNKTKMFQNV